MRICGNCKYWKRQAIPKTGLKPIDDKLILSFKYGTCTNSFAVKNMGEKNLPLEKKNISRNFGCNQHDYIDALSPKQADITNGLNQTKEKP